ncbi:MAG: tetratricopeptide repeat protein [Acidobacteriota bacterium]
MIRRTTSSPACPSRSRRAAHISAIVAIVAALCTLPACTQYEPFDSVQHLENQYATQLGPAERTADVSVPFALDPAIIETLETYYKPSPNELRRVDQTLHLIFERVGLEYALLPTRSAVDTYQSGYGNCLSFVNLFVGVGRHLRLNPFYVEVTDYQRWNVQDGQVVSRGHIVAGMYVKGELRTFDFLPYAPKAYKDFNPVDDLTASAHHYNNLGAEALLRGELDDAIRWLDVAVQLAPTFAKALNNRGVAYARVGELDRAIEIYRQGLVDAPENVELLTNLARAYQIQGKSDIAQETLAQIDTVHNTNPFFFVYKGEQALASGDTDAALEAMRDALKRDSEVPEVHLGLTKVYLARGEVRRARHHLSRALRLDATHPEARRYAAMIGDGDEGVDGDVAPAAADDGPGTRR